MLDVSTPSVEQLGEDSTRRGPLLNRINRIRSTFPRSDTPSDHYPITRREYPRLGPAPEELIHEESGDGIMSAITSASTSPAARTTRGDRVVITFDGKFLDYRW